jgi:hypothetical protein
MSHQSVPLGPSLDANSPALLPFMLIYPEKLPYTSRLLLFRTIAEDEHPDCLDLDIDGETNGSCMLEERSSLSFG